MLTASDPFCRAFLAGEFLKIVLPLAVLIWLATAHRLWRAWPFLIPAALAAAAVSATLWTFLYLVT